MKVIFIKNLAKIAKKDEVKEQPDGYVRNFLLPQGYAIIATPEALKKLERTQSEVRVGKEIQTDLFKKNLREVAGKEVTITVKTNAKGSLFQSIHEKDVIEALMKQHHIMIDAPHMKLAEPIKQTGTFTATVSGLGMKEEITVIVKAG